MASAKKTAKKTAAKSAAVDTDIARKIWLAGVGAYGRMFTETQGAVEKLAVSASEAFDQLVIKGEEVEDHVREAIAKSPQGEKVASMVGAATSKVQSYRDEQRAVLEARIGKVRKTLGETLAPLNIGALAQAVEKLSTQVETLTDEVAALKLEKAKAAKKVEKAEAEA
jgi:poly(hydroxyalkanoate) granule-associated protein